MLTTNKLHKTYGKGATAYEALRGVDLKIKDGESLAILGKSGSGKSTLMHLLAGLDSPSSGKVVLDDSDLASLGENELSIFRNQRFGFIFQQFFLQPNLTVLENVILPLKIAGVKRRDRKQRGQSILKKVGLLEKQKNRATDLSGGQKQRVAIARALIAEPKVIFADEPTGNLDTETSEEIIQLLLNLHKENGVSLVVVTHDQDIAKRCDRQIHIRDGKVQK